MVLPQHATVSALIDYDSKWWNVPLIFAIFSKEEAEVITSLPLSKYDQNDLMIWRGSSTGDFTLHNAYYMDPEKDRQDGYRENALINPNHITYGRRFGG
jgi:hypothetical protein